MRDNTGKARDGDIFVVCATVVIPAVMLTGCDISLRTSAANIIQQYTSATGAVSAANKPSSVSAHIVINQKQSPSVRKPSSNGP